MPAELEMGETGGLAYLWLRLQFPSSAPTPKAPRHARQGLLPPDSADKRYSTAEANLVGTCYAGAEPIAHPTQATSSRLFSALTEGDSALVAG
ncbi:hypothetical protein Skr01_74230 [Sphaerisporangium krabiense]|nr:hypothetical protein Skr01_74230 [Sphaerisporangium krabiense]